VLSLPRSVLLLTVENTQFEFGCDTRDGAWSQLGLALWYNRPVSRKSSFSLRRRVNNTEQASSLPERGALKGERLKMRYQLCTTLGVASHTVAPLALLKPKSACLGGTLKVRQSTGRKCRPQLRIRSSLTPCQYDKTNEIDLRNSRLI
jgi:hypothetical protein